MPHSDGRPGYEYIAIYLDGLHNHKPPITCTAASKGTVLISDISSRPVISKALKMQEVGGVLVSHIRFSEDSDTEDYSDD